MRNSLVAMGVSCLLLSPVVLLAMGDPKGEFSGRERTYYVDKHGSFLDIKDKGGLDDALDSFILLDGRDESQQGFAQAYIHVTDLKDSTTVLFENGVENEYLSLLGLMVEYDCAGIVVEALAIDKLPAIVHDFGDYFEVTEVDL